MKVCHKMLRITNVRIVSQVFFFVLFVLAVWAAQTDRLGGYPVSRFLEIDPLVALASALSTGYVYRFLGWSISVLIVTLLLGRVFCGWLCPFGALSQFISWLFSADKPKSAVEKNRYKPAYFIKYALVIALLMMAFAGLLQIGLFDPICLMYRTTAIALAPAADSVVDALQRTGTDTVLPDVLKFAPGTAPRIFDGAFWIGGLFIILMGMNLVMPRFFCRVLCPLGALLGVFSRFVPFRIKRDAHKCTDCGLCLSRCEGAADPNARVRTSECMVCFNCMDDCPEDAISFGTCPNTNETFSAPNLSRRKMFFAGIGGLFAAVFLKTQRLNTDKVFSPFLIRPPGAVAEGAFLEKCVKCGQCANVCPTNVIQLASLAEGVEVLWTPVMKFDIGHCQRKCILCSEVCPTGAIRKITVEEKLGKGAFSDRGPVRLGTAFYDRGRCLPHAMDIPCVVCEEVCPVSPKAIQTQDVEIRDAFGKLVVLNKPFIVPDLCIGCGICQTECPVKGAKAVYVTVLGESRSKEHRLLLHDRNPQNATGGKS